jgi:hypothetical protein
MGISYAISLTRMKLPQNSCALFASILLASSSANAAIIFTVEDAGVQQTSVVGALTETFDARPLGNTGTFASVNGGTYTGGQISAANQYGGAGGTGRYSVVGLGVTTTQTLTFAADKTYLGLWWSAGDPSNSLQFYNDSVLVASFVIGNIIPFLSSAYLGNPNAPFSGQNAGEYYAYLNFTGTGGTVFDKVVFNNTSVSGFESDNHSTFDQPIAPPGNSVPDGGSTVLLLAAGLLGIGAISRRFPAFAVVTK